MKIKSAQFVCLTAMLGLLVGPTFPSLVAGESNLAPVQKSASPRFSSEERARRKQQIKERLARQISELRKKRANGELDEDEHKRLQRLEQLAARLHRGEALHAD